MFTVNEFHYNPKLNENVTLASQLSTVSCHDFYKASSNLGKLK